jgi:hypothetical protein
VRLPVLVGVSGQQIHLAKLQKVVVRVVRVVRVGANDRVDSLRKVHASKVWNAHLRIQG